MIDGSSVEDRQEIARYIEMTTEALLLNHKGIPMDGGSKFTAQLLTPITVYNELIVSGKLDSWLKFISQKKLPKELELYRAAVQGVLSASWRNLDQLTKERA